ncbi:MAG: cytochrome c biogenesis factor, partial [Planctomycetes bacterium]|nr:cytochrome c biogenesis factor [Planctomycetota bacterium]
LFAWNGQRFEMVSDFLGAGSVGEMTADGGSRPPRPEESLKIEAAQLVPRSGRYVLKVSEPMDEVTYLDKLRLLVVDHPPDTRVYPDERFATAGSPASQDLLALGPEIFPVRARDHHGRDVTAALRSWDRDTVHDFARRAWLGFAEDHWVELDFGDRLARFGPQERLCLCLAGWTDYAWPETIWAAAQAGVPQQPPRLERLGPDGQWQPLLETGFPAGLPRMMTVDVTGKVGGPTCVLRLRTNMTIFWDQVFVAPIRERLPHNSPEDERSRTGALRVTPREVSAANLAVRGLLHEYSPDGRQPTIYADDRLDPVPVSRWAGRLTRCGDVTELLRDVDDRFVIFGPGDEVTVSFDAGNLPALPSGWKRDFVLRTRGYCKDSGPFTATGGVIEPLPFRGMHRYPYGPEEQFPNDAVHEEYRRQFNTRFLSPAKPN